MRVRKLLIILLLLASLCVSGYTYAIWWGSGPSYAPIAVQIPKGVSLRAAAAKLETAGVICCRSEEHTSELQSLMRISYAVFCLKKKNITLLLKDYQLHSSDQHTKYNRYTIKI